MEKTPRGISPPLRQAEVERENGFYVLGLFHLVKKRTLLYLAGGDPYDDQQIPEDNGYV
jgi:hypothetical protein